MFKVSGCFLNLILLNVVDFLGAHPFKYFSWEGFVARAVRKTLLGLVVHLKFPQVVYTVIVEHRVGCVCLIEECSPSNDLGGSSEEKNPLIRNRF